jgi:hypothetical protein
MEIKNMQNDDSGQFLLLSAIIISLGMVILLIFINQSSMAGHSSSDSIMSFPKNDLRDISDETSNEIYQLGRAQNGSNFNNSTALYIADVQNLYRQKGTLVNVSCIAGVNDTVVENATLLIDYYDGETAYHENTTIFMNLT